MNKIQSAEQIKEDKKRIVINYKKQNRQQNDKRKAR